MAEGEMAEDFMSDDDEIEDPRSVSKSFKPTEDPEAFVKDIFDMEEHHIKTFFARNKVRPNRQDKIHR